MSKTALLLRLLSPAAMLMAGCQLVSPVHPSGATLVIAPRVPGRHLQALFGAYTLASIDHLTIQLFDTSSGSPSLVQSGDLSGASIPTSDVSFSNLKQNTTYKIQAIAYATDDDSTPISVDASSTVALETTNDDAPTLGTVPVVLRDRVFNGAGSASGADIQAGAFLPDGIVTTLAGSSSSGFVDGTGSSARFSFPESVAIDASGTVYVADTSNNEIRKITPEGVVSTLAGSTTAGSADGVGTEAGFYQPNGVAVDASGTVYVADAGNNEIRKITPDGLVTTLAGSMTSGSADGTGSAAHFDQPYGVAVDASGNVYVADQNNNAIRKITPAGVVTTLAGSSSAGSADGSGAAASFNAPCALAVDVSGDVFVADSSNHAIRQITPDGVVTPLAGGVAGNIDGTGAAAAFRFPNGITVSADGVLYVADAGNDEIREVK
ncbi:MAG TPA: NHL repeat-containing protein [Oscillatoriaceae cyanobacterium]